MKTEFNWPHRIEITNSKKLVGFGNPTSFHDDKTPVIWKNFMMRRHEITNRVCNKLFSLQLYPKDFTPDQSFTKYALAEVFDFENVPEGFQTFELEAGKYVVFNYKGKAENASEIFRYIFQNFIPENNFEIDARPHFEVFTNDYDPKSESAEEEIWVPIK